MNGLQILVKPAFAATRWPIGVNPSERRRPSHDMAPAGLTAGIR